MANYTYVILSKGHAGREEEFRTWYKEQHLSDVARLPGVVSARLLFPDMQMSDGMGVPEFSALALYELDTEEPKDTIDAMFARAGTEAMPISEAMDMNGFMQLVAHEVHTIS